MKRSHVQPTASLVRKSTSSNEHAVVQSLVKGTRINTDTGFTVEGTTNKFFETFYELILPGCATALFNHPTKTRVYRVMDGFGFLSQGDETRSLKAGDELVLEANTQYRLCSTHNSPLHLSVVQEAKYDAKLQKLQPAEAIGHNGSIEDIEEKEYVPPVYTRSKSKAVEQSLMLAGMPPTPRERVYTENNGINAQPRFHFDEE